MELENGARVLIVGDDPAVRDLLACAAKGWGFPVKSVSGGHEALQALQGAAYPVMLTDAVMPGVNGQEFLRRARAVDPSLQVIVVTAYGSIPSAVQTMRDGAFDYVAKPFDLDELRLKIERALEERSLKDENIGLKKEVRRGYDIGDGAKFIGASASMQGIYRTIAAVARNSSNVLIEGPTGTGKELVAKAIHYSGPRARKPLLPVNCGSMSPSLLESQLFGHVKGAFTGAIAENPGFFVAADGGTLFLDEVTEIDSDIQVKLLRAIQEKEVTPVGGTHPRSVDVRIVAATNRDAKQAMSEGRFRSDLYYRLGVVVIGIPPLRERREDIPALVAHFNRRFAGQCGVAPKKIEPETLERLRQYDWPGNVRELENVVERAFALSPEAAIGFDDLPQEVCVGDRALSTTTEGIPTLAHSEKMLVERALAGAGGTKARAARMLGINRRRLYRLIEKHRLG